jgi:N-acetyl sugar amidotransferase
MKREYKICTRCVMDTSATEITFNDNGVCNFCSEFSERSKYTLNPKNDSNREKELRDFVARVKKEGKNKEYDCIVGVSGGVDSSWVLVKAVEMGLRPLAVHMDNGWNSELAQNNISSLVQKLGIDLHTHVIDWQEYRELMECFFLSDVVDVELLYDNAMLAVNYQQSSKYGIKTILGGTNQVTEGMKMPEEWNQLKLDKRNIKAIAKKFGNVKLKTFPSIGVMSFLWYEFISKNRWFHFLDMLAFNKQDALDILQKDYGYKPYPYKHYESIFTRFYQGFILPEKFGIDKRRAHFSTLIVSGQMTRGEACKDLESIPYFSEIELSRDREYFLKKMHWDQAKLDKYINRSPIRHSKYSSEEWFYKYLIKFYKMIKQK